MDRLLISFSGGESSAFMTQWLIKHAPHQHKEVVFANTGQENEETLRFALECAEHFGFQLTWVEAQVSSEFGKGTSHRLVNFMTASRNGQPFEAMIKKYGIPNQNFPHCTRELKQRPIQSYLRSIGWKPGTYETAIGIRADEFDRVNPNYKKLGIIYPLLSQIRMTKPDVNSFWRDMPFRLQLKGYQGNCRWCWKKSLRKHLTIITENPEAYEFPARMERDYGISQRTGKEVRFFRNNMKVEDISKMAVRIKFEPANDDMMIFRDEQLDLGLGCSESCDAWGGD